MVIPRESVGTAQDVLDRVPPGTPAETPIRLRVEQVSSVEHATVVGVPGLDAAGAPWLVAGLGRPLVLTTLEQGEAMRILAQGDRRRPLVAALCLAGGFVLITVGIVLALVEVLDVSVRRVAATQLGVTVIWLLTAIGAAAASPSPGTVGGDPRSSGQGPGLVGDPAFAIMAVLTIGLLAVGATLVYVRLTASRGR